MPSVSFQIPPGPQAQSGCLLLSLVLSKWMVLRNIIFPAISVNKDVTVISELMSLEGTQKEKSACHLAATRLQPLLMVSRKEAQDVKSTEYWPQIAETHIKGIISVSPDSCIFPYIEKH